MFDLLCPNQTKVVFDDKTIGFVPFILHLFSFKSDFNVDVMLFANQMSNQTNISEESSSKDLFLFVLDYKSPKWYQYIVKF